VHRLIWRAEPDGAGDGGDPDAEPRPLDSSTAGQPA